ncbi:hypothetical protein IKF76_01320, partial [Candidatus Saccharibacteria bacterium]|nr:hypothetical protein [Candidatus Saccharibacteria bacterium]
DTVYVGESIKVDFAWNSVPRSNPDVHKDAYATISRKTRVQIVEFMVSPDIAGSEEKTVGNNKYGGTDVCTYYGDPAKLSGYDCNPIFNWSGYLNPDGKYNGDIETQKSFDRTLPDVAPGTKYCVAMGIWPSDSHNRPDEILGGDANNLENAPYNGQHTDVGFWRISNAACRTLHKKPNFQVWGAGIFTNAGITTSVSKKTPGAGMGDWNQGGNPTHIFGSWDEYAVISRGEVKRFASAAAYGYQANQLLNPTGGAAGGSIFCKSPSDPSYAGSHSKLTLGGCIDDATAGKANVDITDTIIDRLKSRYILSSSEINSITPGDCRGMDPATSATCGVVSTSNINYIRAKADTKTVGDVIVGAGGINADGISDNKGTIVIDATGYDITIQNNICYLDPDCVNNNLGDVKLRSDDTAVDNIATLPQVLIFANNIKIAPNVSQVDAWLIADNEINTCSIFAKGTTDTTQCNQILTINGPVFAKTLSLNRTAGANPGDGLPADGDGNYPHTHNIANDGSITPAEIFNLRPDTYYWAYSQAQRFSQAVVTYSRELAPRY